MVHMSSRGHFFGQNDVRPALHVPMVYESIAANPPRWDYRVVSVDPREEELPDEARLSQLGAEGWLLVGVLEPRRGAASSRVHYYFVRQKEA